MKHIDKNLNVHTINAETLVALWELTEDIRIRPEGVFSRNYSEDIRKIEPDIDKITLSVARDGIVHLLPDALFFKENQLKEDEKKGNDFMTSYDKIKKKKNEIFQFFQPFDTAFFTVSLELEKKLNEITKKGNRIFLQEIENPTNNEKIDKIIPLIPFANKIKGNQSLLTDLLKNLLDVEKIEVKKINPFHTRFYIHKEGLSKDEFLDLDEEIATFFDFFCHWFLPIEQKFDFRIKDKKQPFILGESLILDYNTHL